jgi:cytidyltransferase-like protein
MKPYKYGFIVMRAQPVHKGHQKIIEKGITLCENFLILLGVEKERTARNPFSYDLRKTMLQSLYGDVYPHVQIAPISERFDVSSQEWGNIVLKETKRYFGDFPDCMIFGLRDRIDRELWFSEEAKQRLVMIPYNNPEKISGTKIRNWIRAKNIEKFKFYTDPKIHSFYEIMHRELMKV